jgi:hypothetical protein
LTKTCFNTDCGHNSAATDPLLTHLITSNFVDGLPIYRVCRQLERLHAEASSKSPTYTSAPVERHYATEDEEGVTLTLPALTALQPYHDGVLSADSQKSVELTVAGRLLGAYFLQWMRGLPGDEFGNPVILQFGLQPARKERRLEPNACGLDPL